MVQVDWDGRVLTCEGTSKMSRVALAGQDHAGGPVVILAADIAGVELKDANMVKNGTLTVHTTQGRKYQLHYRRKQTPGFQALAEALRS